MAITAWSANVLTQLDLPRRERIWLGPSIMAKTPINSSCLSSGTASTVRMPPASATAPCVYSGSSRMSSIWTMRAAPRPRARRLIRGRSALDGPRHRRGSTAGNPTHRDVTLKPPSISRSREPLSARHSRTADSAQRVEHRLQIEGRAADHLEHVGGGGLLLQRLASSSVRAFTSSNRRTFSMAITAWSANVRPTRSACC